jgi:hypothetical protein
MINAILQVTPQERSRNLTQKTQKKTLLLTGAFLSIGFITNFLSLNEIFRISLQGKPILGVNLKKQNIPLVNGREQ